MGELNIRHRVSMAEPVFEDREDAGRALAAYIPAPRGEISLVLALPRGGIPVAAPLAQCLAAPLEVVVARKLPIPDSPEMGFGAVAVDGTFEVNRDAVSMVGLSRAEIERIADRVAAEVRRRARVYAQSDEPPDVVSKHVYMVDDGLATGYSVLAAVRMVRKGKPESVTLCVPVSPVDSLELVRDRFDAVYCLYAQEMSPFAVASFYLDFHDLDDDEVIRYLR
jgi:putative phosphoribosyl transferase